MAQAAQSDSSLWNQLCPSLPTALLATPSLAGGKAGLGSAAWACVKADPGQGAASLWDRALATPEGKTVWTEPCLSLSTLKAT